jgi:hypothetical protein
LEPKVDYPLPETYSTPEGETMLTATLRSATQGLVEQAK